MIAPPTSFANRLLVLCRGEPEAIAGWLEERDSRWFRFCFATIVLGCGLYGAVAGWWQAPRQALYAAIKFPLVILLTLLGNAILNGMLAQVLGLGLTFRQTSLAILMSFVIVALILGALAPIALFVLYNCPSCSSPAAETGYNLLLMIHILVIAHAGVAANVRLFRLLKRLSSSTTLACRILLAWLAGNLFLGTQLSWILSPFVGLPHVPVVFLQDHPFEKNFFEHAFEHAIKLLN